MVLARSDKAITNAPLNAYKGRELYEESKVSHRPLGSQGCAVSDETAGQKCHLSAGQNRREILQGYIGRKMPVLCETTKNGLVHGYTPNFIETRFENKSAKPNDIIEIELCNIDDNAEFVFGR